MVTPGVNVVGYLDAVIGQGESARRFCDGLDAAQVPWSGFVLDLPIPAARPASAPRFGTAPLPHQVTVLWSDPSRYGIDLPVDASLLHGRFTIGRWAWELDAVPFAWRARAPLLDEVWVISEFVADVLRRAIAVPVAVLPLPIAPSRAPPLDRSRYGVREDAFLFYFSFDHHSTMRRKNPLALVDAYRRAFGPGTRTALLIKSVNAASRPDQARLLSAAAAGRDDIHVLDAALPSADQQALLAGCDCYVSLHCSEGFGISMAEAISHGRPVIATGYGGNLEFMAGDDLLVGFRMRPVGPGAGPYPATADWAEPDVDHAAALMRRVAADPGASADHGRRAAARLAVGHAPHVAGQVAASHVARAYETLRRRAQPQQPSDGSSRSSSGPSSSSSASE